MRRFIVLALIALSLCASMAVARPAHPPYALVRVDVTPPAYDGFLLRNRDLDIAHHKPGSHAEIVARPVDLEWLDSIGARYEVLSRDMEAEYAEMHADKGVGYGLFHTYSEIEEWLDQLTAAYPQVVSAKWSIGQTHEGRDLWCVRVSDNPGTDETGEPEVLFDGMHHAREIMASEMPVMLIEHLASNYGVDPVITHLLDTREIYVVPVVNPDGSVYNETNYPNGGGMWRKNRRNNGDGTYGVDPNRNYPYEWVGSGSSTDPSSDVYRGPSAGSEPEVQAMMALVNAHEFVTSQSFHTYSNLTLYPWGHTLTQSPDHAVFTHMAAIMTRENGYAPGTAPELLYEVNGGSFDWVYGAQTEHDKCFAFSNEIGGSSDGFWPDESRRDELFQENLWPSLYQIMAAGAYVEAHSPAVAGGNGDQILDAGESAGLAFTLENLGVVTPVASATVTLSCDDPYLQLVDTEKTIAGIAALGSHDFAADPFAVTVDPALPGSRSIKVTATVDADGVVTEYALAFTAGGTLAVFSDDMETGVGDWALTGTWGLTASSSHSPSYSLTDTPSGSYVNDSVTSATAGPIALGGGGELSFWHSHSIESGWDYGNLKVSTDGSTWSTLDSFTGSQTAWVEKTYDLTPFAGGDVWVQFEMETDYSITYDGWYIDDVTVTGSGSGNQLPEAPALVSPAAGETVGASPALVVSETVDPEGDTVTYGFRVFADAAMTQLVASTAGEAASGGQASWTPAALTDGDYWWRAFGADSVEWGLMGETGTFTVSTTTGVDLPADFGLRVISATGSRGADLMLQMPGAGDLRVDVYNARGQVVRTLASGHREAGPHMLTWDGRDASGRSAASGMYFVRARSADRTATGRVLLVR